MSRKKKNRRQEKSGSPAQTAPVAKRSRVRDTAILAVVAAVGVLLGMGWWNYRHPSPETSATATPVEDREKEPVDDPPNREDEPSDVSTSPPEFAKLQGQWVRADGGYILDIKRVDKEGKLDAAYLNPNPIHIAKAAATRDGAAMKVFVELQDMNYPGSTYDLTYDAAGDRLTGVYFQAVQQQSFEVAFDRAE